MQIKFVDNCNALHSASRLQHCSASDKAGYTSFLAVSLRGIEALCTGIYHTFRYSNGCTCMFDTFYHITFLSQCCDSVKQKSQIHLKTRQRLFFIYSVRPMHKSLSLSFHCTLFTHSFQSLCIILLHPTLESCCLSFVKSKECAEVW